MASDLGAASAGFAVEEFITAITTQLDRVQDALRLKSVNRPLTYALKDLHLELKVFVDMAPDGGVRLRSAAPNESGASTMTLDFTTVTRAMVEENTISLAAARSAPLETLGLSTDEQRSLERIGVTNLAQLNKLNQNAGTSALARYAALPTDRVRSVLAGARGRVSGGWSDRPPARPAQPRPPAQSAQPRPQAQPAQPRPQAQPAQPRPQASPRPPSQPAPPGPRPTTGSPAPAPRPLPAPPARMPAPRTPTGHPPPVTRGPTRQPIRGRRPDDQSGTAVASAYGDDGDPASMAWQTPDPNAGAWQSPEPSAAGWHPPDPHTVGAWQDSDPSDPSIRVPAGARALTLHGENLLAGEALPSVRLDGQELAIEAADHDRLRVALPLGATDGVIEVHFEDGETVAIPLVVDPDEPDHWAPSPWAPPTEGGD